MQVRGSLKQRLSVPQFARRARRMAKRADQRAQPGYAKPAAIVPDFMPIWMRSMRLYEHGVDVTKLGATRINLTPEKPKPVERWFTRLRKRMLPRRGAA